MFLVRGNLKMVAELPERPRTGMVLEDDTGSRILFTGRRWIFEASQAEVEEVDFDNNEFAFPAILLCRGID